MYIDVRRKPLRSIVTIVAVALGVFAVICSMSIVKGIVGGLTEYIEVTGGYGLVRVFDSALVRKMQPHGRYNRPLGGVELAVMEHIGGTGEVLIAPEIGFQREALSSGNRQVDTYVVGASESYMEANNYAVAAGRGISIIDNRKQLRVIVLSPEAASSLFPKGGAIGSQVTFGGFVFQVVGLLKTYKFYGGPVQSSGDFKNRLSLIPLATAQELFFRGQATLTGVHMRVDPPSASEDVRRWVDTMLPVFRGGHHDVTVDTRENEIRAWRKLKFATEQVLGTLSALILAVGGLGIANALMASVNERIHEIGIRRATGATGIAIGLQFLIEGTALSLLGGAVGCIAAWTCIPVLRNHLPPEFPGSLTFQPTAAVLGLIASVVVGCLASAFPAARAARMSPVAALRH